MLPVRWMEIPLRFSNFEWHQYMHTNISKHMHPNAGYVDVILIIKIKYLFRTFAGEMLNDLCIFFTLKLELLSVKYSCKIIVLCRKSEYLVCKYILLKQNSIFACILLGKYNRHNTAARRAFGLFLSFYIVLYIDNKMLYIHLISDDSEHNTPEIPRLISYGL